MMKFIPLEHCKDIDRICKDLNHEDFIGPALLAYPQWQDKGLEDLLDYRYKASVEGERLHLMIFDDAKALGWIGLVMKDYMETSIFLHPDTWGSGLSHYGYRILWYIAHEILGYEEIVASVDIENKRSVIAHKRLYPSSKCEEVYEHKKNRTSVNYHIRNYPKGDSLDPKEKREIFDMVSQLTFMKIHTI